MYATIIIPDILDTCLCIDSDTFFLKPTLFIKNNKCLYDYSTEYHIPYFKHMERFGIGLKKLSNFSGICHHMIFEKKYINELFTQVEKIHNDTFYNVFLKLIEDEDILGSGTSEYEIYFNFMLKNHRNDIEIRNLNWCNTTNLSNLDEFDYVSYHCYTR